MGGSASVSLCGFSVGVSTPAICAQASQPWSHHHTPPPPSLSVRDRETAGHWGALPSTPPPKKTSQMTPSSAPHLSLSLFLSVLSFFSFFPSKSLLLPYRESTL